MSDGDGGFEKRAAPGINPVTGQPVAGELDAGDLERLTELIDPAVLADEVSPGENYDLAGASGGAQAAAPPASMPGQAAAPTASQGQGLGQNQGQSQGQGQAAPQSPEGSASDPQSGPAQPGPAQVPAKPGNPQAVNPLAAALTLMLASPQHRHLFLADLEWRLLPAIAAGQFRLITKDNRPLAFVTWAFLSDEIRDRLKGAMNAPGGAASGAGRLKPEEWRSGKHHVIVDFVSPFITDEDEKKRLLASVFGAKKKEAGSSE